MNPAQPPIGLVLKQLDRALSAYTDKALSERHLTRIHWQMLNVVRADRGKSFTQIVEALGLFADEPHLKSVVDDLATRGWIVFDSGNYALTAEGKDGFAAAAEIQNKVREQLTKGIARDEYDAVIATLQKMLENL